MEYIENRRIIIIKKQEGIHLYVNIKNLDKLVIEDAKDGKLNHVIHQMNTLFTSIEKFANDNYSKEIIIEKVTGSRLHLIINGARKTIIMIIICKFAYMLSKQFKTFSKYSSLDLLSLQFGADVGYYCDAEIKISNDVEYTSIGYPANYAAKLQSISDIGSIYISKKLFDMLGTAEQNNFQEVNNLQARKTIEKYNNGDIYSFTISKFDNSNLFSNSTIDNIDEYVTEARNISNNLNYNAMNKISPTRNFTFDNWNVKNIAEFNGTVVYADVRGFTTEFEPDGSNLETLVYNTISILNTMYNNCINNHGIHIQFQGDREYVLFPHNLQEDACFFAIKLIDEIKKANKHVGVGIAYGKLFGFKIGIRGSKDNVMLGIPAICADNLEDLYADEDTVAISDAVYDKLKDNFLKSLFKEKGIVKYIGCKYYSTTFSYNHYVAKKQYSYAQEKPNMPYTKPYGVVFINGRKDG